MTPAEYVDAVSELDDAPPCEHGHFGCALHEGGRCSNAVWAEHACAECGEIECVCDSEEKTQGPGGTRR